MLSKVNSWISVVGAILFVVLLAILSLPVDVSAAPPTNVTSNSCLSCHEDLYYLHDTGKYYCITEHKDRCVNCHEGDASVMSKEESHLGLLAHPQKDNGAKCQECHTEDVQTRLATFAIQGGYKAIIESESYTPSSTAEAGFPETSEPNLMEKIPWLVGGVVLFGFWLVLVLFSPQKP
jgi:hypothetical protein